MADDHLARLGQFAVAPLLGRQVDDDAAGLHRLDHLGGDQPGRGLAGNQRGGDDDVDILGLGGVHRPLGLLIAFAHDLGVTAGGRPLLLIVDLHELRAHGLDLVLDLGAGVGGAHDGAEPVGRADGGQSGDADADDEDLGGRHLAGRGDLAGEKTPELMRGFDDGAVAGYVGHGTQGVEFLGTGDARDAIHGQDRGLLGGQLVHQFRVLGRPDETDQSRPLAQVIDLVAAMLGMGLGSPNLEDDVRLRPDTRTVGNLAAHGLIGLVGKVGAFAGAIFDRDGEAQLDELLGHLRNGGNPLFAGMHFFGDTNSHLRFSSLL